MVALLLSRQIRTLVFLRGRHHATRSPHFDGRLIESVLYLQLACQESGLTTIIMQ